MTKNAEERPPPALDRRFWALLSATVSSGLGDGLVLVAFPLLAAQLTDDPRLVSGVAICAELPWLLLALPAGGVVDRAEHRSLLFRVEVARVIVLVAFGLAVVAGWSSLALLYLVVFVIGAGQTVFAAGVFTTVPRVVPTEHLTRANGLLAAGDTAAANMVGPALGGLLFAVAAALPFLLDGVSFALSAALVLLAVPVRPRVEAHTTTLLTDVRSAWRFFWSHALLRQLAFVIASLAFCQSVVAAPLVLYALRELGLGDAGFGVLLAVGAVGHVAGGLAAGRLERHASAAVLLLSAAVVAAGGYLVVGVAGGALVAGVGLVIEAVAVAVGNVASITLRQRLIPTELLGRVGNIFRFFIYGAIPLGALAGGFIASEIGLRAPQLTAAALQLAFVVVLGPSLLRKVRTGVLPAAQPA
jgi:MFS family permease